MMHLARGPRVDRDTTSCRIGSWDVIGTTAAQGSHLTRLVERRCCLVRSTTDGSSEETRLSNERRHAYLVADRIRRPSGGAVVLLQTIRPPPLLPRLTRLFRGMRWRKGEGNDALRNACTCLRRKPVDQCTQSWSLSEVMRKAAERFVEQSPMPTATREGWQSQLGIRRLRTCGSWAAVAMGRDNLGRIPADHRRTAGLHAPPSRRDALCHRERPAL